ncbi:MAG: hypothetical protein ACPGJV_11295 [Bacteriovoracaceae bacterium]
MKYFFIFFLFLSCGPQKDAGELTFFKRKNEHYSKLINNKTISGKVELKKEVHVENSSYPIELSLYENGEFYYHLKNLGEGRGTWILEDTQIKMFARRSLFDMAMQILSTDEEGRSFVLTFRDRFGPKQLKLKINHPK